MEFNGIPLHPLVVHAAVVFTPLAALAALALALRPQWNRALRWPAAVVALIAAVSVQVAVMSGEDLVRARGFGDSMANHADWADKLRLGTFGLTALLLIAAWRMPMRGVAGLLLRVLLLVAAVLVSYFAFMTGDTGAKAVWGQTG